LRVVVDTNVLVSAVLFRSSQPAIALRKVLQHGTLLISQAIFEEWHEVLARPKFDRYVVEALRTEFLETILNDAVWVEIQESVIACRDPKDDKFLALAVNGQADFIVTGDRDLLVLNPFREISIVSPEEFIGMI
jgi:uncharacterized protein